MTRTSRRRVLSGIAAIFLTYAATGHLLGRWVPVDSVVVWIPLGLVWALALHLWLRRCGWWRARE